MARAPKFNAPRTSPPASGWKAGHRPPPDCYGQLDGNAYGDDKYDNVSEDERREWPDCDAGSM